MDLAVTLAGAALWLGSEVGLKGTLAPSACHWCSDPGSLDRSVRDSLLWSNPDRADTISNVLLFGGVPAAGVGLEWLAAGHDGRAGELASDALIIAQATVLSADLNQAVKLAVGRARPCVHFGTCPDYKTDDRNLSFYSGHSSVTFALATAAGTVASMRGYRLAPLVWAGGLTLAATTGYLRIAADRHYFSDVMVGAAVGSAFGILVPRIFHGPMGAAASVGMLPETGGVGFCLTWRR